MRNLSIIKKVIVNGFSLSLLLLIGCELDPVGGYYVWDEDCQCEVHISEYEKNSDFEVELFIDGRAPIDDNGYYHLTLSRTNWQTLHRMEMTLLYDGEPAQYKNLAFRSNLFWELGDTLGYIHTIGLTDDMVYVSVDTSYIILPGDNVVPTSNQKSITDDDGVTSNMLPPVQSMVGDTMNVSVYYRDGNGEVQRKEINYVLE